MAGHRGALRCDHSRFCANECYDAAQIGGDRHRDQRGAVVTGGGAKQRTAAAALLALGVFVWLFALFAETWARIDSQWAAAQIALAIVAVTAAMLVWLSHKLKWGWPLKLSWVHFVAHIVVGTAAVAIAIEAAQMPSRHYGWIVWPLAWGFFYARLAWEQRAPLRVPTSMQAALHVGGLWLLTAMIAAEAALRIDTIAGDGWFHAIWGAVPAVALWLVVQYAMRWPMRAAPFAYASIGAPGLAIFTLAWILFASVFTPGDPAPIGYLPLLNPLDLASLLALAAVLRWHLADQRVALQRPVRYALGVTAFIALNAAALRAVHFLAGVPWNVDALWNRCSCKRCCRCCGQQPQWDSWCLHTVARCADGGASVLRCWRRWWSSSSLSTYRVRARSSGLFRLSEWVC